MYLSIVVPAFNSSETIIPLLESIRKSRDVNLGDVEIIIVDDRSSDDTVAKLEKYFRKTKLASKVIALEENSGPAKARNIGVKYARGKKVLFFDADVIPHPYTVSKVINYFKNDPDLFALTGVWDKKQRTGRFFPKFKALRDWSYWINERDPKNYYYLFSTRVAAIDRGLFLRLGGFDTTYKAALVEDMELTYRIAKRHAVIFAPDVIVHHEFEDFAPIAKKYFWRSYFWSKIYRERKRFDPVATTSKEAITTVTAAGVAVLGLISLLSYLGNLSQLGNIPVRNYLLLSFFFLLSVHLWGVRKFMFFLLREEGPVFALRGFVTGIVLYIVILSGAVYSLVR